MCACARIVVSSGSVVGGEFEIGNSVSSSLIVLMKISDIGFVRAPSEVEVGVVSNARVSSGAYKCIKFQIFSEY